MKPFSVLAGRLGGRLVSQFHSQAINKLNLERDRCGKQNQPEIFLYDRSSQSGFGEAGELAQGTSAMIIACKLWHCDREYHLLCLLLLDEGVIAEWSNIWFHYSLLLCLCEEVLQDLPYMFLGNSSLRLEIILTTLNDTSIFRNHHLVWEDE